MKNDDHQPPMPKSASGSATSPAGQGVATHRLPLSRLLAYGIGSFAVNVANQAPKVLAKPVYNITLGVSPAVIGAAMTLCRIVDAVMDPLMGYLSDNTQTRWGRRRPYIIVGTILTAVAFVLLWWCPRDLTTTELSVYFTAMVVLYYIAFTVLVVPYTALGYEQSEDYGERTRVMSFATFFASVATLAYGWAYAVSQSSIFTDAIQGIRAVAIAIGTLILITGIIPGLLLKEAYSAPVKRAKKIPLFASIGKTLKQRSYVILTGTVALMLIGTSLVNSLGLYVMIYHIYGGDTSAASVLYGWYQTGILLTKFAVIYLIQILAERFGKKATLLGIIVWGAIGSTLRWITYSSDAPYLVLVDVLFFAPPWVALSIVAQSMIADVCDLDEVATGQRREGMFGAVYFWIYKSGMAAAYFASGILLVWIGFNAMRVGPQPEETIRMMRLCFLAIPAVAFAAAGLLLARYDLTQKDIEAARAILDARRAEREGLAV